VKKTLNLFSCNQKVIFHWKAVTYIQKLSNIIFVYIK